MTGFNMDSQLLSALLGMLGGIISGAIAAYAVIRVYRVQNANLEGDELRRKKVEIIYQLIGSRYVLSENYFATAQDVLVFNTAMALFTTYFSDNKEIMRRYDAFRSDPKNTDKLVELLREAGKSAGLDLLDSTIKDVLTVQPRGIPLRMIPSLDPQSAPSDRPLPKGER